jgi:hypothetical protein
MRGRRIDPAKAAIVKKYGLSISRRRRLSAKRVEQLVACKDESARRLLLGVGRKKAA